ncbi:MAG: 2-amino-4-hydroxy-6-hydroxymethyldihydropteridine diphosphokinase [Flavobacteriales bacterium]|jgi:2-amino-4-hydroxy-6-hydroxymethyldihydropteridine diphosphokinase|nr:2-amino-4-hydroxy-6-hydroxymethyldihydropteridine diphosphokinase [Flavobacteriales bacterium]
MNLEAVLLLGSNFDEKEQFIELALIEIAKKHKVLKKSAFYYSAPFGFKSNNEFVNLGILINTNSDSYALLKDMLEIENKLGRKRRVSNVYIDRAIDIDIILFSNDIVNNDDLVIPHPRMHMRNFCLTPLSEIIPNYIVPGFDKTINQLLSLCEDNSEVTCLK